MKKILTTFVVIFCCLTGASAQKVAIKHNFAYDALLAPNLSLEFALGRKWTIDTQYGTNFFVWTRDVKSPNYTTKKWSHWLLQSEARYWTCESFNGLFVGGHVFGGEMNVGKVNIPYFVLQNKKDAMGEFPMKKHRYEGWYVGAGVSVGYHYILSNRFSLEASIGAGYAFIHYNRYGDKKCDTCDKKGNADYIGPTKATLSLIYMIK